MSGGTNPLDDAPVRAALNEIERDMARKRTERPASPIILPKSTPRPSAFDPDKRTFETLLDLEDHLKECKARGVLPRSIYYADGRRFEVERKFFRQRPVTADDATRLQTAELKKRRKSEARIARQGALIGQPIAIPPSRPHPRQRARPRRPIGRKAGRRA
jgi:hypothetical protein